MPSMRSKEELIRHRTLYSQLTEKCLLKSRPAFIGHIEHNFSVGDWRE